ncbi:MAG: hypothetical protein MK214_19470 [Thalassotalea sp.]|nr:hypothetical protein [Thalassotalea sp.]
MGRNQQEPSIDELKEHLDILSKVSSLKENEEFCGSDLDREYLLVEELSNMGMFSIPVDRTKSGLFLLRPVNLSLDGERYFRDLKLTLGWKNRFWNKFKVFWDSATSIIKIVIIVGIPSLVAFLSNLKNILN